MWPANCSQKQQSYWLAMAIQIMSKVSEQASDTTVRFPGFVRNTKLHVRPRTLQPHQSRKFRLCAF